MSLFKLILTKYEQELLNSRNLNPLRYLLDLLRTDPGAWSDFEGRFYYTMDEVSPPLPSGWQADQWRASSEFGSEGFQYAAGFHVGQWSDKKGSLCTVRRRLWYRIISLAPIKTSSIYCN